MEALANPDCGWFYRANADKFSVIPGSPIAYWASSSMISAFKEEPPISDVVSIFLGMTTADNNLFVRNWWEVSRSLFNNSAQCVKDIKRWAPYNKGGDFRRWYGNQQYVINWENDGIRVRTFADQDGRIRSTVPSAAVSLKECLTWSKVSSGRIALRYFPEGSLFDVAGASGFGSKEELFVVIAFLNSTVAMHALSFMSPTLNFEGGQVRSLPLAKCALEKKSSVLFMVEEQIMQSSNDWNSFETSWDFKHHPLI